MNAFELIGRKAGNPNEGFRERLALPYWTAPAHTFTSVKPISLRTK